MEEKSRELSQKVGYHGSNEKIGQQATEKDLKSWRSQLTGSSAEIHELKTKKRGECPPLRMIPMLDGTNLAMVMSKAVTPVPGIITGTHHSTPVVNLLSFPSSKC